MQINEKVKKINKLCTQEKTIEMFILLTNQKSPTGHDHPHSKRTKKRAIKTDHQISPYQDMTSVIVSKMSWRYESQILIISYQFAIP